MQPVNRYKPILQDLKVNILKWFSLKLNILNKITQNSTLEIILMLLFTEEVEGFP